MMNRRSFLAASIAAACVPGVVLGAEQPRWIGVDLAARGDQTITITMDTAEMHAILVAFGAAFMESNERAAFVHSFLYPDGEHLAPGLWEMHDDPDDRLTVRLLPSARTREFVSALGAA
jgi:hypothetical protein